MLFIVPGKFAQDYMLHPCNYRRIWVIKM